MWPTTPVNNLAELVLRAAERAPDAGVRWIIDDMRDDDPERQSYSLLLNEARRIVNGLRAEGLAPKDRVVLLLDRPRDVVPALWACLLGGFVPCPVTPLVTDADRWDRQLAQVNEVLGRPLFVADKGVRGEVPPAADRKVVSLDDLSAGPEDVAVHKAAGSDPALLMLTSGSTGASKAVMLTHDNILAALAAKAERLAVTAEDTMMNWIAFDHIAAMEMHFLPLYLGASQVQVAPTTILADPMRFVRAIERERITLTFTPNFLLGQINAAASRSGEEPADLSSLRHLISGGEATVRATGAAFLSRFGLGRGVLVPGFGMTETCAGSVFSLDFPDVDAGREFASLGIPVRGVEMRVVDDAGALLPEGQDGELQLRGPVVFEGYLNNPEATRAAFTADGWFRTGDRAMLRGGRLTLVGRSKDSIIVNGVNYYSHDLETVLDSLDGVEASYTAAFPIRPPGTDTEQLVVVFSPSGSLEDEAEIYRLLVAVRGSVVMHWGFRPAFILPLPKKEIPKTSLGKISRSLLRKRVESGALDGLLRWTAELTQRQLGGYTPPTGPAEETLTEIYGELFGIPAETVSATASFFELGGTSMDILRLKLRIERSFGVSDLPVIRLLTAPTVRELAALLRSGEHSSALEYRPLLPLQRSGDKTPLFCVHPGVGEVLVFVNLAKYFVNERPFYALRARGFGKGEPYFSSFREMVECYVRAIREEQPHGPYAVAGYSYGGAVAFEIAKALESEGERVDFVGVFNLPPHIRDRMEELDFVEGAVNLAFFLDLVTKRQAAELPAVLRRRTSRQGQLAHLIEVSSKQRLRELDLDTDSFGAWVDLAQSLVDLGRTYEPCGTVKSLTIFYAIPLRGTKEDWLNNNLRHWDKYAREENRYVDVDGEHYTLMGPKHVGTFQATLRRELSRALGED